VPQVHWRTHDRPVANTRSLSSTPNNAHERFFTTRSCRPVFGDENRRSDAVAAEFLEWLRVPANAGWLDVGCGTGALGETILERAAPREVVAVDAAEPFVSSRKAVSAIRAPRFAWATPKPCLVTTLNSMRPSQASGPRHRHPHGVPQFRRLLDAVPRRAGTRSGLLRVAVRGGTRSTAGTPASHAHGGGRRYDFASGPRFRGSQGTAHLRGMW